MNRVEITRLAQEAGFVGMDGEHGGLRRFAVLVASAEREACAKLLEEAAEVAKNADPQGFVWIAIKTSAEGIRKRGQA